MSRKDGGQKLRVYKRHWRQLSVLPRVRQYKLATKYGAHVLAPCAKVMKTIIYNTLQNHRTKEKRYSLDAAQIQRNVKRRYIQTKISLQNEAVRQVRKG